MPPAVAGYYAVLAVLLFLKPACLTFVRQCTKYIDTLKQELGTAKTYEHTLLDEKSVVDRYRCHMAAKVGVSVDEDHSKLPTVYRLPNFIKDPVSHVLLLTVAHVLLLSCR